jgi:hypothetical protein
MIGRFLRCALLIVGAVAALQAAAEVKVILKDGRTFSLPLTQKEIERLEVDGDRWRPETQAEKVDRVVGGAQGAPKSNLPPAPEPVERAPAPQTAEKGGGRVLKVGPGRDLQTPGVAAKMARDGDTVEIDAGDYFGDVAIWRADNLTIRGVGGRPMLDAGGQSAEGKAIWVTKGSNITIENIGFLNARVRDRNGAGIRAEGPNLTVRNCLFKSDENGILSASAENSTIVVEHSEFADSGHGDGRSHGIYIGKIDRFIFRFNYVHGTKAGHHVKTRAAENVIAYNLLYDGPSNASYAVDLNSPLYALVVGNVIQQSPAAENSAQIQVGAKVAQPGGGVWIVNNTVLNDRSSGIFVLNNSPIEIEIRNNLLVGHMDMVKGRANEADNVVGSYAFFVDPKKMDFRLKPGVAAVDAGGKLAGGEAGATPEFEYVYPTGDRKRVIHGRIDAGAYELGG